MDQRRSIALQQWDYHVWATGKTLDSVEPVSEEDLRREMKTSFGGIWGTLEHTYKADALWLKRYQGEKPRMEAFSASDLTDLRSKWSTVQTEFRAWIDRLPDAQWEGALEYRLMNGQERRSPIFETMLHVVNHGTYHRGQIVTMLRQIGAQPVSTDFVRFVWEKQER